MGVSWLFMVGMYAARIGVIVPSILAQIDVGRATWIKKMVSRILQSDKISSSSYFHSDLQNKETMN